MRGKGVEEIGLRDKMRVHEQDARWFKFVNFV
jgi:hypothetical protein